jgi:F-type H+-transporting ATPase subunit a
MRQSIRWLLTMLVALLLGGTSVAAQEVHGAASATSSRDIDIMHHLANSRVLEYPCLRAGLTCELELPAISPIHLGPVTLDISPTKHSVYLAIAAILVAAIFLLTARLVKRSQVTGRPARGFAGTMEAMALYIRQEVILPNVGPHGEGYVPYLLTLFFFILISNLLGLLPWGATATGNISVTASLAIVALIVIEVSGMRTLKSHYWSTIFYIPPGLPTALKPIMLVIMTPVEIISKLSKPFALAVRLFANMTAGHVVVLALLGLTFFFQSAIVGVGASVLATGIMLLELFVAFLQAFVFVLLTSVFIGLIRAEH